MKYIFSILMIVVAMGFTHAQKDITNEVAQAFSTGNTASLSKHLTSSVDLMILDTDDVYAKDQAVKILSRFFKENPPREFSVKHQGTSKLNDQYRIGDLVTENGNFRVTFFMKQKENILLIKQIRIEASEGN